jgi:hypothetical protein
MYVSRPERPEPVTRALMHVRARLLQVPVVVAGATVLGVALANQRRVAAADQGGI